MAANLRKLLCLVASAGIAVAAFGQAVPAGTVADVDERTKPFGSLCLQGQDCGGDQEPAAPVAAVAVSGSETYGRFCHICHATGLNDAPKLGDAEAWAPRLAKGMDALLDVTKTGLGTMPPMGTCMNCSDDDLRAAIDYLVGADGTGSETD